MEEEYSSDIEPSLSKNLNFITPKQAKPTHDITSFTSDKKIFCQCGLDITSYEFNLIPCKFCQLKVCENCYRNYFDNNQHSCFLILNNKKIPSCPPIGIINYGNTCYINSSIQCLMNLQAVKNIFQSKDYKKLQFKSYQSQGGDRLLCVLGKIFSLLNLKTVFTPNFNEIKISNGETMEKKINMIKQILGKEDKKYLSNNQEDASQFLQKIIEKMTKDYQQLGKLNSPIKSLNKLDSQSTTQTTNFSKSKFFLKTPLDQLFKIYANCKIKCHQCQISKINNEHFKILNLKFNQKQHFFPFETIVSVSSMLMNFQTQQQVDQYKCDNCKKNVKISKQYEFKKFGKCLIISLGRFQKDSQGQLKKTCEKVKLNLEIKFISKIKDEAKFVIFELCGIINHIGTLFSGHYTCFIKKNKQWYKINDSRVDLVDQNEIFQNQAYMLFYQRKQNTQWVL